MPRPTLHRVAPEDLQRASVAWLRALRGIAPLEGCLVIAPSAVAARLLVRAAAGTEGLAGVTAQSLTGLAKTMAAGCGGRVTVGAGPDRAIVADLLARDAGPYGTRARRPAIVDAVALALRDLRDAGLDALPAAAVQGDERLVHLARLLEKFSEHLTRRELADEAVLFDAAAAGAVPRGAQHVLVHGLHDLTGVQQRFVAALARRVAITWMLPQVDVASPSRALLDEFEARLLALGLAPEPLPALDGAKSASAPDATIFSTAGSAAEAREAARRVLVHAAAGVPFGEMVVVAAGPQALAPLAEQLARAGVPLAGLGAPKLGDDPRARAVFALARLLEGDGSRAEAAAVLRAHATADLACGVEPASIERLLRRAALVRPDAAEWARRLTALAESLERQLDHDACTDGADSDDGTAASRARVQRDADDARALAAVATRVLGALEAFRRAAPGLAEWPAFAEALADVVRTTLGADPVCDAAADLALALGRHARLGVPCDASIALAIWRRALEDDDALDASLDAPAHRRPGEGVLVVAANRARGLVRRVAIVTGLAETDFPPGAPPDPLLGDARRERIAGATGAHLARPARRPLEGDLLFALLRAAAAERLDLSWPRQDDANGSLRLPCDPLARLVPADGERRVPPALAPRDPARPALDLPDYDVAVAADALGGHLDDDPAFRDGAAAHRARFVTREMTRFDGVLDAGTAPQGPLSVTALERLATCPRRYFYRDVLGLDEADDPVEVPEPDRARLGTLVHRVLARTFGSLAGQAPPEGEAALALAEQVRRQVLAAVDSAVARGLLAGAPLLWRAASERVARDAARATFIELARLAAAGAQVAAVEASLQATLRLGAHDVDIEGRLDRLDRTRGGALAVSDYKTGKRPANLAKKGACLCGGERLQLPLYARLVSLEGAGETGAASVDAARYVFLDDTSEPEFTLRRTDLEDLAPKLEDLVRELSELRSAGRFFAVPGTACTYCPYALICGPARELQAERKAGDAGFAAHATLGDRFP